MKASVSLGDIRDPLVSVIVSSYALDRLRDIEELMSSLFSQTYRHAEIVFVADKQMELCTVAASIARKEGMGNLRVFCNNGTPGLSAARNLGVRYATGDIVAFIDDDAIAFPDWLERMVRVFYEHPEAIGVTGPAFPKWEGGNPEWFPEEFFWLLSCPTPSWTGYVQPTQIRSAWGVNMAFRREAFGTTGFSEAFMGGERTAADDVEFSLRVRKATGRPIIFDPSTSVYHKVYKHRLSAIFIRRKAFRDAYAKAILQTLYRGQTEPAYRIDLEITLLKRILLRFFPTMLKRFLRDPAGAWKQFRLAVVALFFTGLGYLMGALNAAVSDLTRSNLH
jgi:GT2 family glycosyltransferase